MSENFVFASGATSGELKPLYFLATGYGQKATGLRFGYGNKKHEKSQTVLSEANWLKAFHARDLEFFRDRAAHALDHLGNELRGRFDFSPGGNWGAVGWCQDVFPFVAKFDPAFYNAIVGISPHPGKRAEKCPCDRCDVTPLPVPEVEPKLRCQDHSGPCTCREPLPEADPKKQVVLILCSRCKTFFKSGERHGCADLGRPFPPGTTDGICSANPCVRCISDGVDCNHCGKCWDHCKCL